MEEGARKAPPLYRRGQLVATLGRWISLGLGLLALLLLLEAPRAALLPCALVALAGLCFHLTHLREVRAEQALALAHLRQGEERYRRLLEGIQDGVLILEDGRMSQANDAFGDMVGREREALVGMDFVELVPPEDRARLRERYRLWERSEDVAASVEARLCASGGETLLVSVRAGSVELAGRRLVVAVVRDVTRQKRLERELSVQAARLAALDDMASAVNQSLTIEDVFDVAAEEASRLVPFDRLTIALRDEEGPGMDVISVGRGLSRRRLSLEGPALEAAMREPASWLSGEAAPGDEATGALLGETSLGAVAVVPLVSGERVIGSLNLGRFEPHPFSPPDLALMESVARHVAIALDNARLLEASRVSLARVSEANRRLEELDRLRQQYLRNVSHEFRSPLTVIRGYAEYLADSGPLQEEAVRDLMRIVVESCDRVIDMVDTLIEVSRIERGAGGADLQLQLVDLSEVVSGALEPLRTAADRKGIILELDLPAEPARLRGDRALLQQVVRKLVDNALKYSPSGGRVVVRAAADGEDRVVEVEDAGVGIPPEHLSRIFDKFYMVDGGLNRRAGGTGVGLYLVREIVRLHHGKVEVRSLPGQGSLFSVRLPRDLEAQPHAVRA